MNHVVRIVIAASALTVASAAFGQKTSDVRVVNPASQPVLVKEVEAPARVKYQRVVSFQRNDAASCINAGCTVLIDTVPAGKRLVVEHISIMANFYLEPTFVAFGNGLAPNLDNIFIVKPDFVRHPYGPSFTEPLFVMDRPVLVYYEAGSEVKVKVFAVNNRGAENVGSLGSQVTLHGQLVDVLP